MAKTTLREHRPNFRASRRAQQDAIMSERYSDHQEEARLAKIIDGSEIIRVELPRTASSGLRCTNDYHQ